MTNTENGWAEVFGFIETSSTQPRPDGISVVSGSV